ncbi:MAG TPA: family 10 glycosylhydrolase [Candidatus Latescibacteria bacterium]|nr:family 10 glycosylhydrolase [Candidatus Latescibacterota bacterium]HOS63205.1 family 10 glycosylhydrolase [Candidatus Latescibacterota bacterium]HPK75839.1 family 10 glycosylhydrolase [Candidatus Latescibacterota bacterium]
MDTSVSRRLVQTIDCTGEFGPDRYFCHGIASVVETDAGRYREAEGVPGARFAYRFAIEHVGRPHEVVIQYPDDKRRFMCVMDGTCYDLTTGVLTGACLPLSGKMLELRQVFWPRWKDCSIVFMTWGEGEPAAAARIEVFELGDLPPAPFAGDRRHGPFREIGVQYEDPCGTCASEGAINRDQWTDRIVAYMKHTGQQSLTYPLAWYHGPTFPSDREPSSQLDWIVAPDRTCYSRWTSHPVDWYQGLLQCFSDEGLTFRGSLTLLRLGSLMAGMQVDEEAIHRGADTYNAVLWNGTVRAGTGDWTPMYDARFMSELAKKLDDAPEYEPLNSGQPGYPPFLYGERANPDDGGPVFNPLHPKVQTAVLGFVREIAERYAKFPAFTGISFNYFAAQMLWFGSLRAGYDDYTISLFQQETGLKVLGDAASPDRFFQRYLHLTTRCRTAWIEWRCVKIRDLMRRIRDTLREVRPDLTVTLTLWQETVVPFLFSGMHAGTQLGARPGAYEFYREGGVDWELFRHEPGILLDLEMGDSRDRGGHGANPAAGVNTPLEVDCMFRDHAYLDTCSLEAAGRQDLPGAFLFNCWVEAWGRYLWFPVEPDDSNLTVVSDMDGQRPDAIVRSHSKYPADGFWWEPQMRITPALKGGGHFLEGFCYALAELDACRITQGGLFLDTAHTEELRRFASVFRSLPNEKFETVGHTTDPVAVRSLVKDDRRYVYLVNREYYPVRVEVEFTRPPEKMVNLATGLTEAAASSWAIALAPYELRAYTLAAESAISVFRTEPPSDITSALEDRVREALAALKAVRVSGTLVPGMERMMEEMERALEEKRYAWLRRALDGYIVRKCRALAADRSE